MTDYLESEYLEYEEGVAVSSSLRYRFFKKLIIAYAVIIPLAILFSVSPQSKAVCFIAYLNGLVWLTFMRYLLCKHTIAAMVPFIFWFYMLLAIPFSMIYFSLFQKEDVAYYFLPKGPVSFFEGGVRFQLAFLVFSIGYLLTTGMFMSRTQTEFSQQDFDSKPMLNAITMLIALIIFLNALAQVKPLPGPITYISAGLFNYLYGLTFLIGVFITQLSKPMKLFLFSFLGGAILFFTVGNARGNAVYPTAMLLLGMLLFSDVSKKIKMIILLSVIVGFPMYLVIGNVTRELLGTVGFEEGFSYRLGILKQWRQLGSDKPATDYFFGRVFFTGGHSIIIQSPETIPYRSFSPVLYFKELFSSLIPEALYYQPYYRDKWILRDFGFNITEKHSVGISMIGSFWLLGGYGYVLIGGFALGLLHVFVMWLIQRASYFSGVKCVFLVSAVSSSLLRDSGNGFIRHWSDLLSRIVMAIILYFFLNLFFGGQHSRETEWVYQE